MGYICKNDEKFLDWCLKITDGTATDEEKGKTHAAIQAFFVGPQKQHNKIQALRRKIQAVSVSTDFPIPLADEFNITMEEDNYDMGWEAAFKQVPLGQAQDFWEIHNVVNGITFRKVDEGGRVAQDTITGTRITAYVDYYGAALGWTDKMIRFRKIAQMVDQARAFRNKFWVDKGNNHYALIAAAAAGNVTAYQGVAGDIRVQRDVLTINSCAFTLGDVNKDKGYGDTATAPFLIYANPADEERIEAAFRVTTTALASGAQNGTSINTRNRIARIYTFNSQITSGSPLMVLPGNKNQKADAMQLTYYQIPKDPLTLNEGTAAWAIYGAIIADTDQCRTFTLG